MRKRFLSFALALCFAIPCMFFLASCGEKSKPIQNFIMTFEEIENGHVHFVYDTNTVKGGENSDGIGKGQEGKDKGKLTLGKGVTIEVSDDGKTWSPYKSDKRHRYMRTK